MIKNTFIYGKKRNRASFIINYALTNIDKTIMIIDFEKTSKELYPLIQLNSVNKIILNSDINNILYYLELLDDIDTIFINGFQNIDTFPEDYIELILIEINKIKKDKNILSIFLGDKKNNSFTKNIKIKEIKNKKLEKKIFKINKELDLNIENIFNLKRDRVKMINNKLI